MSYKIQSTNPVELVRLLTYESATSPPHVKANSAGATDISTATDADELAHPARTFADEPASDFLKFAEPKATPAAITQKMAAYFKATKALKGKPQRRQLTDACEVPPGIGHNQPSEENRYALDLDALFDKKSASKNNDDLMKVYGIATAATLTAGTLTNRRESTTLIAIKAITLFCWVVNKGGSDRRKEVVQMLDPEVRTTVDAYNLMPVHFTSQIVGSSASAKNLRSRTKLNAEYLLTLYYQDEADLCTKLRKWTAVDQVTMARENASPAITGREPRNRSSKPKLPGTTKRSNTINQSNYVPNIAATTGAPNAAAAQPSFATRNQPIAEYKKSEVERNLLLKRRPVAVSDEYDDDLTLPLPGELGVALITGIEVGGIGVLNIVRGVTLEQEELVRACIDRLTSISCHALKLRSDFGEQDPETSDGDNEEGAIDLDEDGQDAD